MRKKNIFPYLDANENRAGDDDGDGWDNDDGDWGDLEVSFVDFRMKRCYEIYINNIFYEIYINNIFFCCIIEAP